MWNFWLLFSLLAVHVTATDTGGCETACTMNFKPVCGTDSQTYSNACLLGIATCKSSTVTKKHDGACCVIGQEWSTSSVKCVSISCDAPSACGPDQTCVPASIQCITAPCPQFTCTNNVIVTPTGGCEKDGKKYPAGSTWQVGCSHFQCQQGGNIIENFQGCPQPTPCDAGQEFKVPEGGCCGKCTSTVTVMCCKKGYTWMVPRGGTTNMCVGPADEVGKLIDCSSTDAGPPISIEGNTKPISGPTTAAAPTREEVSGSCLGYSSSKLLISLLLSVLILVGW